LQACSAGIPDLWAQSEVGRFDAPFTRTIASHDVTLLRLNHSSF
jgi:hypothetical protein